MVMLKIGDALVNEQMFISIELDVHGTKEEVVYAYEATWNAGQVDAARCKIYSFTWVRTDGAATKEMIDNGFKDAMAAIRWDEFS